MAISSLNFSWDRWHFLIYYPFFEFQLKFVPKKLNDFFFNCVKSTIDYREENNVQRNDFMQLLIELKNKGKIEDPDEPTTSIAEEEIPGG